jgi:hypothetical protein
MRDKLSDAVREFDAILKPLPTSRILYLGTPQNEMSLYNDLQERGYKACILPARYPDTKQKAIYGDRLFKYLSDDLVKDPSLEGKPTDPQRFDEEDLQRRELSYGKAGFMLQFMLDTSLSDADKYPLRLRDFNVGMFAPDEAPMKINWLPDPTKKVPVDLVPMLGLKGDAWFYYFSTATELTKYAHKILVVDPSGRGKDETGYAVLYCLNGYIYLMEAGGLLGGYSDVVLNKLSNVAKKHKVKEVVVEGNFGDGMYTKLLTPVLNHVYPNCGITEVKSKGQKEMRIIDTLEPVLGNHKLCVTPECIKRDFESVPEGDYKYALFYQLTRITRDRGSLIHDDRLDALAIGVNYLNDFMGVNEDEGIKELTTEWLEKSMESFMRTATHTAGNWTVTEDIDQEEGVYSSLDRDPEDYRGYSFNFYN